MSPDKKKDDFKDATGALDNVGNVSDIQFKREVLAALDGLLAVVLRRKSEEAIQSSEPRPKVPPQKEANVELTSNISGVLKRLRAEISELMSLAGKSLETRKALEDLKVRTTQPSDLILLGSLFLFSWSAVKNASCARWLVIILVKN